MAGADKLARRSALEISRPVKMPVIKLRHEPSVVITSVAGVLFSGSRRGRVKAQPSPPGDEGWLPADYAAAHADVAVGPWPRPYHYATIRLGCQEMVTSLVASLDASGSFDTARLPRFAA